MGFWSNLYRSSQILGKQITDALGMTHPDIGNFDDPFYVPPELPPEVPLDPDDFATSLTEGDWTFITDAFGSITDMLTVAVVVVVAIALLLSFRGRK